MHGVSAMKIADLRRKAARGTLEVEHLLQAAVARVPNLSIELAYLATHYGWKTAEECEAAPYVPLATWAKVVSAYSEGGLTAVQQLRDEHPTFCVGLLEEMKSEQAVEALLTWWPQVISFPELRLELAWRIVAALNAVLSFKGAPNVSEASSECVRQFAYRLYPLADREARRAAALLMLRGVGDEQSLAFASAANEFAGAWADTKRHVLQSIRRRIVGANKRVQATRHFLRFGGHPELRIQESHQCQGRDLERRTSTASDSRPLQSD